MGFAVTGNDGAPLGVAVAFDDAESRRIDIEIGVDDGAKLSTTGSGLTIRTGDSAALVEAIKRLRDDERERGAMGKSARLSFDERYAMPIAFKKWRELIESVARAHD